MIDHYQGLLNNSSRVFSSMLETEGAKAKLIVSHNYLLDYDSLKRAIGSRPESSSLELAVKEYQFALFALVCGQYRHAFGGLRLFFELMLATIQFSAREIDFRMWKKDAKDISWSSIKDEQNGVFSKNFIKAFNEEFSEDGKQYGAIAETVYRECSEFVHGNAGTHAILPSDISFQEQAFLSWHEKSATMRIAIFFAFSARYLNHIPQQSKNEIEHAVIDVLGHLPAVQYIFSNTSEF